MSSDSLYTERERQVIELYKAGKSTPDIAKEQRMSLRDIGLILKKHGLSHGIAITEGNNKKFHSNEKATQAYKLFGEGKGTLEVAIELNLRQKEASRLFSEFWKLKIQPLSIPIYEHASYG